MQTREFSKALRTELAALALAHETEKLSDVEYERRKAVAIDEERHALVTAGRLPGDGWSAKRSPPSRHFPNGHSACFWKGTDGGPDTSARVRFTQSVSGSGTSTPVPATFGKPKELV